MWAEALDFTMTYTGNSSRQQSDWLISPLANPNEPQTQPQAQSKQGFNSSTLQCSVNGIS